MAETNPVVKKDLFLQRVTVHMADAEKKADKNYISQKDNTKRKFVDRGY